MVVHIASSRSPRIARRNAVASSTVQGSLSVDLAGRSAAGATALDGTGACPRASAPAGQSPRRRGRDPELEPCENEVKRGAYLRATVDAAPLWAWLASVEPALVPGAAAGSGPAPRRPPDWGAGPLPSKRKTLMCFTGTSLRRPTRTRGTVSRRATSPQGPRAPTVGTPRRPPLRRPDDQDRVSEAASDGWTGRQDVAAACSNGPERRSDGAARGSEKAQLRDNPEPSQRPERRLPIRRLGVRIPSGARRSRQLGGALNSGNAVRGPAVVSVTSSRVDDVVAMWSPGSLERSGWHVHAMLAWREPVSEAWSAQVGLRCWRAWVAPARHSGFDSTPTRGAWWSAAATGTPGSPATPGRWRLS